MALHDKNTIRHMLDGDIYASVELSRCLPKYRFPEPERDPRMIYAAVHDELMLDGNARQNLATFCQTWEEPELHKLMDVSGGEKVGQWSGGACAAAWRSNNRPLVKLPLSGRERGDRGCTPWTTMPLSDVSFFSRVRAVVRPPVFSA